MSEKFRWRLSWAFVGVAMLTAGALFSGGLPSVAADDHERVRGYVDDGRIMPLSALLADTRLQGYTVLDAELEEEHGRLVYELELLGSDGRVIERYYDAATGAPLARGKGD